MFLKIVQEDGRVEVVHQYGDMGYGKRGVDSDEEMMVIATLVHGYGRGIEQEQVLEEMRRA